MRILVTRPLEDGQAIAARLMAMGHRVLLAPLLTPRYEDGPEPELDGVQAILATSANGIRALVNRTARRDTAIFAVGPQTAQEARDAGFTDIKSADGDSVALAIAVTRWAAPHQGKLLHVCGAEAPGTLAAALARHGFEVERVPLYAVAAATQLPPHAERALEDGEVDAAMFFSPRSARLFCELVGNTPTRGAHALCISPVTAAALTQDFRTVAVADKPNQDAMLALVEKFA